MHRLLPGLHIGRDIAILRAVNTTDGDVVIAVSGNGDFFAWSVIPYMSSISSKRKKEYDVETVGGDSG